MHMTAMRRRCLLPVLAMLGLSGCFPMPVEDDKHPELPLLSESTAGDAIEVVRLVDSPHVEGVVNLGGGRIMVQLLERNPHQDFNDPKHRAVLSERVLVFDGLREVRRIDADAGDLAGYDAPERVLPLIVDGHGDMLWLGRRYRAGDHAGKPMASMDTDALAAIIGKDLQARVRENGVREMGGNDKDEQSTDAAVEVSPGMVDAIEARLKALAEGVTAYDGEEDVCIHPGNDWVIRGCSGEMTFGGSAGRGYSLARFLPHDARLPAQWRGHGLCDDGIGRCWDRAVAANHCSGNHFVFGCRQSYIHYVDLPIGDAVLRFKSVPGKEAPFAVHRIDPDQVVMASQKGVFVVRRKQ